MTVQKGQAVLAAEPARPLTEMDFIPLLVPQNVGELSHDT
jgi:hypothetical protein